VYRSEGSALTSSFRSTSRRPADIQGKSRREHFGAMAGGNRRQGQRGRGPMTTQTGGAIGYVEYALRQAKQDGVCAAREHDWQSGCSQCGKASRPPQRMRDWANAPGYYLILTNQAGAKSWPITGASFILMYGEPADPRYRPKRSSSSTGRTAVAVRWPKSSTT